jgi:hypothetical protein
MKMEEEENEKRELKRRENVTEDESYCFSHSQNKSKNPPCTRHGLRKKKKKKKLLKTCM